MAILILTQYFGAALWVTVAQSIFSNSLWSLVPRYAPGVVAVNVIAAGAGAVRERAQERMLEGVLVAYSESFDRGVYLSASLAAFAFVFAWGLGFQSIKKRKEEVGETMNDVERSTRGKEEVEIKKKEKEKEVSL
jgi:hypothetical protein